MTAEEKYNYSVNTDNENKAIQTPPAGLTIVAGSKVSSLLTTAASRYITTKPTLGAVTISINNLYRLNVTVETNGFIHVKSLLVDGMNVHYRLMSLEEFITGAATPAKSEDLSTYSYKVGQGVSNVAFLKNAPYAWLEATNGTITVKIVIFVDELGSKDPNNLNNPFDIDTVVG